MKLLDTLKACRCAGFIIIGLGCSTVTHAQHPGWPDSNFQFGTGPDAPVYDAVCTPNGKIYVAGNFVHYNGIVKTRIARLDSNGSLEAYYLNVSASITDLDVDSNEDVVMIGTFFSVGGVTRGKIARIDGVSGALDTSFDPGTGIGGTAYAVDCTPNGQVVIGGNFTSYNSSAKANLARINSDGSPDATFQHDTVGNVYAVSVSKSGAVALGGGFSSVNGSTRYKAALIDSDGSLNTAFAPVIEGGSVFKIVEDRLGRYLVAGGYSQVNGQYRYYLARLYSDGSTDMSFNPSLNGDCLDVEVLPDDKILICGSFLTVNGTQKSYIARLNDDGSLDTDFNTGFGFPNDNITQVEPLPSGKTLVCGNFTTLGATVANAFGRLMGDRTTDCDFDGDGLTDKSFYDYSAGNWYVYSSVSSSLYDGQVVQWGWSSSMPIPFDLDADGRVDWTVYDIATGNWYIKSSLTGDAIVMNWGWSASMPVPGDYNGDHYMDIAVFYPANGNWYIRDTATGQLTTRNWGWSGSIPVPADYDGDGVTDLAVYDLSNGNWYISESKSGAFTLINWGWSGAAPYPVDYNNDGKADLAVYDRNAAKWYVRYDALTSTQFTFGAAWLYAVPGLYTYGGGYNAATWSSTGSYEWNIAPTYTTSYWGGPNSLPVINQTQINRWYGFY